MKDMLSNLWVIAIAGLNVFVGIGMLSSHDNDYSIYALASCNFTIAVYVIVEHFHDKDRQVN